MYAIDIEFVPTHEWKFIDLMDGLGVYSLWSERAMVRPSYIGEGHVADRIHNEHRKDANKISPTSFAGCIGILGYKPAKTPKHEAVIVESMLLYVSEQIDRWPIHNTKAGQQKRVNNILRNHPTLRISIRGCDPLLPPESASISGKKIIRVQVQREGIAIEHDWNRRPVLV